MEVVTNAELAEYFERLMHAVESSAGRNGQGDGPPREYFNRREAAAYLRIGTTKLDELTKAREIGRAKMGDGPKATVLYRRKDLDAFVESRLELDKAEIRKIARANR